MILQSDGSQKICFHHRKISLIEREFEFPRHGNSADHVTPTAYPRIILYFGRIRCGKNVLGSVSFRVYPFSAPADTTGIVRRTSVWSKLCLQIRFFLRCCGILKEHVASISRFEMSANMIRAISNFTDCRYSKRSLY